MGNANDSFSDDDDETWYSEEMIEINVETGITGGYPRKWHGKLFRRITMNKESTVADLLTAVKSLPFEEKFLPITLETLHTKLFMPKKEDMRRSLGEMRLQSGSTLHVGNRMAED